MNTITLSGYLTHDPELIEDGDHAVCTMRLMVKNHGREPTFIDVRAFDEQAYACAEYLRKGRKIAVDGRLVYEEWRAEDDTKRDRYSVVGWIEFLDRPPRRRPSASRSDAEELTLV